MNGLYLNQAPASIIQAFVANRIVIINILIQTNQRSIKSVRNPNILIRLSMRKKRQDIKIILLKLCAVMALLSTNVYAVDEEEEVHDYLKGIRYRNETAVGTLDHVSMCGGLEFFIDGAGFDEQAFINTVLFKSLQTEDLQLAGPPLDIDDEIQSAPPLGRLAYTMPSLEDLFGMPLDSFNSHFLANNGDESIRFYVKVQNNAENSFMPCEDGQEGNCLVKYRKKYTPMLQDISPSNVYLDQDLTFYINPMAANQNHVMKEDADPVDFIKFSGTRNDFEGKFDSSKRLSSYRIDDLPSRSGDQHPGNSIPEIRFRTGNACLRETAKHCNFAGDDCWYVKTHPKIDTISATSGYLTGGQELTITGWGLAGTTLDDVEVLVDGVSCAVTSSTLEEIKCTTGAAEQVSNDGISQPGSPGLTHKVKEKSPYWDLRTDETVEVSSTQLLTAFEHQMNVRYYDGMITTGWFKAPETGRYRFYIACDDACKLFMNTDTPFDKSAPAEAPMTEIAARWWVSEFRHYFAPPPADSHQYISDWVDLAAGEFYKIEGYAMEWSGDDHFTVSVEFEQADTTGHHHANKEIQILSIETDMIFEQFEITISGATGAGVFKAQFFNPLYNPDDADSFAFWLSDEIADDVTASTMRDRIQGYFQTVWGSNINVEKVDYDALDAVTEDSELVVKSVYTVSLRRLINGPSYTSANIVADAMDATVSIGMQTQESTEPLSGSFKVTCPDPNGNLLSTREFDITHWTPGIDYWMQLEIPHTQFKIQVRNMHEIEYRQNGVRFAVIFQDYHGDAPDCYLESGTDTPIAGGGTPVYTTEVIREYGQNLMFEPVPLEFIYTDATQPQVLISVNGIDGVCPDFNCGYLYVEPVGEILTQQLNDLTLTITGTSLPTTDVKVKFSSSECIDITASETEITCTLNAGAAAGSWNVQVSDANGLTPLSADVIAIDVPLVIESISPYTDLNQLGGDILTITGTGFDLVTTTTDITFSDNTKCNVLTSSSTEVTCEVDGFDSTTLDTETPYTITISVNGVEDATQTVALLNTKQSGTTISPSSVSPVLASELTVTLEATYPEVLDAADFGAVLVDQSDVSITRPLYIMSVDDTNKTIKIKFPGADSGNYYVQLNSVQVGRIDKTFLALEVFGKVTGFTPSSGSVHGGSLVTIDGINFSDDPLDNPVKVGDHYCLVEETSATQITCRIMETYLTETSTSEVIVFLRTSEEAQSDVDMTFEYVTPSETMTNLIPSFDDSSNSLILTATGTGFTDSDTAGTSLYIDGLLQETLSVTSTAATFKVINALDEKSSNMRVYFASGLPKDYDRGEITMVPTLVSISPSSGSSGGTLITVTGTGFGVNTADVTLVNGSNGEDLCDAVTITGYGTFTCLTKAVEINSSDSLQIRTASGSYTCGNTQTPSDCQFEQLNSASPTVTSVTVSSSTELAFVGTSFPTTGYSAVVIVLGVESSSATINDDTSITATFEHGIPISSSEVAPSLRFVPSSRLRRRLVSLTDSDEQLIAFQTDIMITNSLSVTDSTSGLSCSFQGGCSYSVTADGLFSTLEANESSYIDVCGNQCVLDSSSSTASEAVCTLPYVSTAYSAAEYEIVKVGVLHEGIWTGTASDTELAKLIDNKNMIDMVDATSSNCYFQIQYKENHVGVLDEVKFFINNLTDKTPFVGKFVFQGSDDGVTFTDLWTIDKSVHEGWNSHDFEENQPSYNIYRFQGTDSGSCRVGEVRLHGIESIDDDNSSYTCTPKLVLEGTVTDVALNSVTFDSALTPVLTGMSSRFGSVLGGEVIEFYGTGFSGTATTTVMIDDRECDVDASQASTIHIICTTLDKPYRPDEPTLVIWIEGMGYVATMGKVFRYVSRWSDSQTWGYDLSPQEGEAVNIPKGLHLLFDIDTSPKLSFIVVEGSLIFPPDNDANHQRSFDAHYILVRGGYMEVGTEEYPYTSKLTITMHSSKYDPNLPIFGNKVIGVNYGTLEMHGVNRPVTWTDLKTTVEAGGTSITLNDVTGDPLDWQVGEEIVIASTDFNGRNAEQRTIASITNTDTNPVITFTEPLLYKHYAGAPEFGGEPIEMRAEVGLLTRNVKYQGDPETSAFNQYGAVIIMHSPGDETTAARIENIELYLVGQAFILGSYPIHFHMIGTVHSSYIRNNAIHHTFNRAVTIHGIHYLRVQNNVAYHTMGHTIFIEDAAETKNLIENNLIVDVRRSWSLLNTDQTPASIWITNPDNIIRGNHAAGSDRYSYWYDTQKTAIGPSFDENICPENTKLGEFRDNVAHSNGRYGLRIFHNLIPREHPCEPMVYDPTDPDNPYPDNPPIMAEFHNLISYKNRRNGAIAERVGAVQFHNFKTADNILAGIEFSLTEDIIDGWAKVVGGMVVGRTENTEEALDIASPHGIIAPRTENFSIYDTKFYNYDWNDAAGLGSCSHCFHPAATDSGARTIRVNNLYFDETVTLRVRQGYPYRVIFFDETGSLTNLGPNTWHVPYWPHLVQPECTVDEEFMGGIVCDSTVQVRRIAFHAGVPDHFFGMEMKITRFENDEIAAMKADGTYEEYIDNNDNYSQVEFRKKLLPANGWAMPYVTGHKYRIHWRRGLDFDQMKIEVSERWEPTDLNVLINMNFTETREAVNFTTEYGAGVQILNETLITKSSTTLETGDNWILNDTETREINFVVNGRNPDNRFILMEGLRCIHGVCTLDEIEEVELEEGQRLWSDAENWGGTLPAEGDDVEVPSGWNMLLDLEETPVFKSLTINGRLTFMPGMDIHLRSKQIFVRAGEFFIGSEEAPFENNALITLHGMQDEETLVLSGTISAGNKIMATVGDIKFFGLPRDQRSRLLKPCYMGETQIVVDAELDWRAGDQIYLAPTALQFDHSDYRVIESYQGGLITLTEPLNYYHWGAAASTADEYNGVDMRGEVILLNRNIKIQGEDVDGWGGQVLVTDYFETDGTWRKGQVVFDNVQFYNCSQQDTYKATIRWEGAIGGSSKVTNSVTHNGLGWSLSVFKSNNVFISDSAFIGALAIGVHMDNVRNITFTDNFIADVTPRVFNSQSITDKEACVAVCSYMTDGSPCHDLTITNNIAAGCKFAAYIAPGHDCDDNSSNRFKNNIGHSCKGAGAAIYPDKNLGKNHDKCYKMSHFSGYKTTLPCLATFYKTKEMLAHDITCIDNEIGVNLQTAGEGDDFQIKFYDSQIYGETEALDCPQGHHCYCPKKAGFMMFGSNVKGKDLHIPKASSRPIYKIKAFGAYGGEVTVDNVSFNKFNTKGKTKCSNIQSIFQTNPYASDKIPFHHFYNTKFNDVDDDSMAFFYDPPKKWAIVKDCGAFPCTAPNNVILSFSNSKYSGVTPISAVQNFQIIPDDPDIGGLVGGALPSCVLKPAWQGYQCTDRSISLLVFESLDDDSFDRSIQPIFIVNEELGFNNTLNSMMDHVWDGFYTGQLRASRFPGILSTDADFTLDISGTPPKKMRFKLEADQGGVKLKIPYPVAGSVTVYADGKKQEYTPWSKELGRNAPLQKTHCGENRFVGIENFLEFYITPNCEIKIEPRDAIMTKVRMEWSLTEFYSNGGVTRFVDRMAASLGINANRIKTVAVYEGSVIVDFEIEPEEGTAAEDAADELAAVQQKLVTQANDGTLDLGAPIMGIQGSTGEVLAGDPIPDPVGVNTGEQYGDSSHSAIVDDENLWDHLIFEPEVITIQEEGAEPETPTTPSTEQEEGAVVVLPEQGQQDSEDVDFVEETVSQPEEESNGDGGTLQDVVKVVKVTVVEEELESVESTEKTEKTSALLVVIPAIVVAVLVVTAAFILFRVCAKKRQSQQIIIKKALEEAQAVEEQAEIQNVQYIMDAEGKSDIFSRPQSKASGKRVKIGIMPSRQGKRKGKNQEDNVVEAKKPVEEEFDDGFNNYSDSERNSSNKKFDLSSRSSMVGKGNDTLRQFVGIIASEAAQSNTNTLRDNIKEEAED